MIVPPKRYYIKQYSYQDYNHGGVGYVDAEKIFEKNGFQPISFPWHFKKGIFVKVARLIHLARLLIQIKRRSVLIFIFPVFAKMNWLLIKLLVKKNVIVICYLADIDGIKDGDKLKLESEIRYLNLFRYFIVHNNNMKDWLSTVLPNPVSEPIEFFDFLTQTPDSFTRQRSFEIVFAGNLEKSPFVEDLSRLHGLSPLLYFNLYGPNATDKMLQQVNTKWHGVENPYELPVKLKGSYGLVWDGTAIDKPGGDFGVYMKYISHHKLSLYILSGLPIIVACSAGSAPLVQKYNIGICVNSLFEIQKKIQAITDEDYLLMQQNMKPLAKKIQSGLCAGEAIEKILSTLINP